MPSSFSDLVKTLGPRIDAALDARTQLDDGCPARLREAMRYSLLAPGKRIRPMLALLAARACGGTLEAAMPAACAVEMVHAYSLIHDDLPAMDDDDLRRGRPTCHKAFDEATAILAGDGLLTLAFEVLAREIEPPAVAAACCAALARAAGPSNMVGGQADDVNSELGIRNSELRTPNSELRILESIHHRKTGAMIRVSLELGAMTAAANPEQLAALDAYGKCLGLAFQITDDLLDLQSTEAAMGKRVGKDAGRGKLTFPGLLGLDQSTQHARQWIAEACRSVAGFDPPAEGLLVLAQYVLERNH
jgi:geranylgeranyl diphosphate synthase, type II